MTRIEGSAAGIPAGGAASKSAFAGGRAAVLAAAVSLLPLAAAAAPPSCAAAPTAACAADLVLSAAGAPDGDAARKEASDARKAVALAAAGDSRWEPLLASAATSARASGSPVRVLSVAVEGARARVALGGAKKALEDLRAAAGAAVPAARGCPEGISAAMSSAARLLLSLGDGGGAHAAFSSIGSCAQAPARDDADLQAASALRALAAELPAEAPPSEDVPALSAQDEVLSEPPIPERLYMPLRRHAPGMLGFDGYSTDADGRPFNAYGLGAPGVEPGPLDRGEAAYMDPGTLGRPDAQAYAAAALAASRTGNAAVAADALARIRGLLADAPRDAEWFRTRMTLRMAASAFDPRGSVRMNPKMKSLLSGSQPAKDAGVRADSEEPAAEEWGQLWFERYSESFGQPRRPPLNPGISMLLGQGRFDDAAEASMKLVSPFAPLPLPTKECPFPMEKAKDGALCPYPAAVDDSVVALSATIDGLKQAGRMDRARELAFTLLPAASQIAEGKPSPRYGKLLLLAAQSLRGFGSDRSVRELNEAGAYFSDRAASMLDPADGPAKVQARLQSSKPAQEPDAGGSSAATPPQDAPAPSPAASPAPSADPEPAASVAPQPWAGTDAWPRERADALAVSFGVPFSPTGSAVRAEWLARYGRPDLARAELAWLQERIDPARRRAPAGDLPAIYASEVPAFLAIAEASLDAGDRKTALSWLAAAADLPAVEDLFSPEVRAHQLALLARAAGGTLTRAQGAAALDEIPPPRRLDSLTEAWSWTNRAVGISRLLEGQGQSAAAESALSSILGKAAFIGPAAQVQRLALSQGFSASGRFKEAFDLAKDLRAFGSGGRTLAELQADADRRRAEFESTRRNLLGAVSWRGGAAMRTAACVPPDSPAAPFLAVDPAAQAIAAGEVPDPAAVLASSPSFPMGVVEALWSRSGRSAAGRFVAAISDAKKAAASLSSSDALYLAARIPAESLPLLEAKAQESIERIAELESVPLPSAEAVERFSSFKKASGEDAGLTPARRRARIQAEQIRFVSAYAAALGASGKESERAALMSKTIALLSPEELADAAAAEAVLRAWTKPLPSSGLCLGGVSPKADLPGGADRTWIRTRRF